MINSSNTNYIFLSYLAIIIIIFIICYSSYNKYNKATLNNKETFNNLDIDELYTNITGHVPIDILNWNVHHTYGEVTNEGMKILNEAFNHHGPLHKYDIPKKTFYDLGCGVGKLIITIANNNSKINSVGYEIVTDRVNKAKSVLAKIKDKQLLDRLTLKEQDIFDNNLDFIISSDVFEHINPLPSIQIAFNNLYKMLKNGGTLIFSVPYNHGEHREHYPNLYNYKIEQVNNEYLLIPILLLQLLFFFLDNMVLILFLFLFLLILILLVVQMIK
jgi:SAM-dependent methyltransferase